MRLALITIAFLLHSQISAAATTAQMASGTPAKTVKTVKTVKSAHQGGITSTHMKMQPGQEAVRVNAVHRVGQAGRQTGQHTPVVKAADEPEDLSYGTLLATLVLMAAIAVRRLKAGRA
jgi:hypothetical protein